MQRFYNGILLVPFFVFSMVLSAQINSVSPYSRLGLGDFQTENFARAVGFSGANIALGDKSYINHTNPASYSNLELTTFEIGFLVNMLKQEQANPPIEVDNNNAGLRYFTFGLPVQDWWGSAIGLQPYTARGYQISSFRYGPDSILVEDSYGGQGGLSKLYWGNAFEVAKGLSLGINASYIFGRLEERNTIDWGQGINNSIIDQRVIVRSFRFDYGVQYAYTFQSDKVINLGVTLANQTNFNAEIESYNYITTSGGVPLDSVSGTTESSVVMPTELGLGIGFGKKVDPETVSDWWANSSYEWMITGDFEMFQGSDYVNYDGTLPFADAYKVQLGTFMVPAMLKKENVRNGSYFGKIEYRLGGFYEKTQMVVKEQQLDQYGITFGMGLPIRHAGDGQLKRSMINASVALGRRGSLEEGLIQESFVKIFIGITLNDRWFIQRKYR